MSRSPAKSGKAIAMKSLNEKWLIIVQLMRETGENEIGGSSTVTLPPLLFQDSDSNIPSVSHSGGGCTSCSCGWATGAHMTELSTNGAGAHVAGALGMSRGGQLTKGADVFWALGANVVGRLTLEALHHGRYGRGGVGNVNGVGAGAGNSHNHFQSSRQSNASRAYCWSSSSVNSRPTSLSWSCVPSVMLPRGKGVRSARGKRGCTAGQLRKWVDCSVGRGHRVGGCGGSSQARGVGFDEGERGFMVFFFLNCSLHCVIGAVVGLPLSLRQREDNSSENRGEVVSRKCPQKSVESLVHQ